MFEMVRVCEKSDVQNPYLNEDPRPWAGHPRAADKDRIAKFVVVAACGATTGGTAAQALSHTDRSQQDDQRFVRDFFKDHLGMLAVEKIQNGYSKLLAHPTPLLAHLVFNEIGIEGDEFDRIYHTGEGVLDEDFSFKLVPQGSIRVPPRVLNIGKEISDRGDIECLKAWYPEEEFDDRVLD